MASARAGSALIPPPHNIRASRADRDSPCAVTLEGRNA
jgi:hypothetical protein